MGGGVTASGTSDKGRSDELRTSLTLLCHSFQWRASLQGPKVSFIQRFHCRMLRSTNSPNKAFDNEKEAQSVFTMRKKLQ